MTVSAGDGPGASPETTSFVGRVISGRYKVLEQLGEGGMGTVYLAEHVHMRKRLAIKVLNSDMVSQPEVVARFEREAVAAAHIDHPNVAAATDFGRTEDGAFFLVLEYIEGTDLRAVLRGGALEVPRALHIARQVASALTRAHELGIVHRDLKPENVMLVDRGDEGELVKVLDFGIAKVHVESLAPVPRPGVTGAVLTRAGAVFGTPEYMAPEQALGEAVDARADLYALGVIMFEMLSGKLPFEGNDTLSLLARQIAENAPMLRTMAPDRPISPELEALVMRLLAKQPRERYGSAEELLAAIDSLAVPPPGRAPTKVLAPPSSGGHIFTPADAMARTSPEIPGGSAAAALAATRLHTGQTGASAPAPGAASQGSLEAAPGGTSSSDAVRRRHLWIAVIVAFCGGALAVGALMLLAVFHEVKKTVLGADGAPVAAGESAEAKPEKKAATDAQITAAVAQGTDALEKLLTEFPGDPRILRAIYRAQVDHGDAPEAMRTITRLLAADPTAASDPELATLVSATATDASPEAREAAIDVLEGPMGAKGADVLYDLATRTPPPPGKARFAASLNKSEVIGHASPALSVLLDLRAAKTCEAKRDVLPRVRESGDARVIPMLKTLQRTRGCGFLGTRDCYPCLHRDNELDTTFAAVSARAM